MNTQLKKWASVIFNRREEQVEFLYNYFHSMDLYLLLELAIKNTHTFKVPNKEEGLLLIERYKSIKDPFFKLPEVHKDNFFYKN